MKIKTRPRLKFLFLLAMLLPFSMSCELPLVGSEAAKPTTSTGGTGAFSTSCTSSVVDTGQKGSIVGVARGLYSDTKMIPGTNWPATAYVDQSAVSLKFTYWNGTQYATEVISPDGNGAFVRFDFLFTGVPVVIWTLGANIKAAIRSAPISSAGTWSAGIIDTAVAPRAAEISVNPLDQVAVSYITDTATTGRPRFLYCDATCASPSSFQTMNAGSPQIENTAVVAAQVATGVGWCKVSSTTYYPVAAYSVTGNTKYAVCMNSLNNCLSGASWTTQSVVATGNLSTKLMIDSNITGDVPKVVSLGAAGIIPYRMGATVCSAGVAAFSAGPTIGTATSGNQWITILKDSFNKFHLVANEGTTSVRYYNSTSTDIIGAWNAQGAVDTVTLAAPFGGGAAISSSDRGVYASYGINAVPYDLRLGRVNDYTQNSNAATFTKFAPDLTGNFQLQTAGTPLKNIATASTAAGKVVAAYVDFSVGAVAGAKLKFAYRNSNSASSSWQITLIPGTLNPQFPGLVVDSNNRPWVSYFDASLNLFRVATNSLPDGTGNWTTYDFPSVPSGGPIALPAANQTAMGLFYGSGGVVDPIMFVIDTNAVSKGVKAARFSASSRNFYTPVVVDGLAAGALGATNLSVDYDTSGNVVVAFQDLNANRVRYTSTSDAITYPVPFAISGVGQGQGTSIRINRVSGSPSVSYFDQANNAVFINSCSKTPALCTTSGWTPTQIEGAAGVSGLTLATAQLVSTSLNFTSSGTASIFYPRGQLNDGNLLQATGSGGVYSPSIAAKGANASISGAPALNFGVAGWGVSATGNSSGSYTALYIGPGNWLYATSCGD